MTRWAKSQPTYGPPVDHLITGRVEAGAVWWDSLQSKGCPEKYQWRIKLPRGGGGRTVTREEAMAACEAALAEWLKLAELSTNDT